MRAREMPKVEERRLDVKKGQNVVSVSASGHTWVALVGKAGELVREESGGPETSFGVEPGTYTVASDGKIEAVKTRSVDLPDLAPPGADAAVLRLTSDAKDEHPVDGVGEIPADGASYATVTIEKLSPEGEALTRQRDKDEVYLRATGGSLQNERGKAVRSVKLKAGRARFRLVSEASPRVVTVEALAQPPVAPAELRIEFV